MPIKWNMNVLERRNLDCFGPMIAAFLGIFPSFHRILRYGTFAFIYKDPAISTRLLPIRRYLERREICLGFGHKYNISSYLLLRRQPTSVISDSWQRFEGYQRVLFSRSQL